MTRPDTQFYGLSAFPYAEQYLGLLWSTHTYAQTMDLQLASSRDGVAVGSDRRPQAAHPTSFQRITTKAEQSTA